MKLPILILMKLPILILICLVSLLPFAVVYVVMNTVYHTTGVCLFKGPFIAGGLFSSSSDGIPLRNINITVRQWANHGPLVADGATDRTGCFTYDYIGPDYASYSYNGINYTDTMIRGVILRDNLP